MAKALKGIRPLDYVLNEFLEEFGLTAHLDTGFYYYNDDTIGYSLFVDERLNAWYLEYVKELAPDIECDVLLASILHEVGHHECDYLLSIEEDNYCEDRKIEIANEIDGGNIDQMRERELNREYFALPDEYKATMWAIEYMRNNIDKVARWWKKVQEAVMRVYILNGVELNGC